MSSFPAKEDDLLGWICERCYALSFLQDPFN
jgi:hypothetical protein